MPPDPPHDNEKVGGVQVTLAPSTPFTSLVAHTGGTLGGHPVVIMLHPVCALVSKTAVLRISNVEIKERQHDFQNPGLVKLGIIVSIFR